MKPKRSSSWCRNRILADISYRFLNQKSIARLDNMKLLTMSIWRFDIPSKWSVYWVASFRNKSTAAYWLHRLWLQQKWSISCFKYKRRETRFRSENSFTLGMSKSHPLFNSIYRFHRTTKISSCDVGFNLFLHAHHVSMAAFNVRTRISCLVSTSETTSLWIHFRFQFEKCKFVTDWTSMRYSFIRL